MVYPDPPEQLDGYYLTYRPGLRRTVTTLKGRSLATGRREAHARRVTRT